VREAATRAAVLIRDIDQQHAEFARHPPHLAIDVLLLAPLFFLGGDVLFDKTPHGLSIELKIGIHPGGNVLWHDLLSFLI
jgi:hypothetical protein